VPRDLSRVRRQAIETFRSIAGLEQAHGIELAQGPSGWFFGVALDWCRGASIEDITGHVQLGEGDVVSLLNKTIDLLDQFEQALARFGDSNLQTRCAEARGMLLHGLVAMVRSGDRVRVPIEVDIRR